MCLHRKKKLFCRQIHTQLCAAAAMYLTVNMDGNDHFPLFTSALCSNSASFAPLYMTPHRCVGMPHPVFC